jgi:hypothetical protein
MAGTANPLDRAIYRVVNLGTAAIVEGGIRDEDKARERLGRELGRVPEGRFAVEVQTLRAKSGSSSGPSEASLDRQADEESDEDHRDEHPDERHGLPHFFLQIIFGGHAHLIPCSMSQDTRRGLPLSNSRGRKGDVDDRGEDDPDDEGHPYARRDIPDPLHPATTVPVMRPSA